MLDTHTRKLTGPSLSKAAQRLDAVGITPLQLTLTGWLMGVAACLAAATESWTLALVLWLGNRVLDGLDGAVARIVGPTDLGGFLDLLADFSIYSGVVLAIAIAIPDARLAAVALLAAYYLSGAALLALSSLSKKRQEQPGDSRSFRFVGGLAEGTETVLVYSALLLLPQHAELILWGFAAVVAITALQRVRLALRVLAPETRSVPAA